MVTSLSVYNLACNFEKTVSLIPSKAVTRYYILSEHDQPSWCVYFNP